MTAWARSAVRWQFTFVIMASVSFGCVSCDKPEETPPPVVREAPPAPSPWRATSVGATLSLDDDAVENLLADAIAEAQRTAPEARRRWAEVTDANDQAWAVQCAATTIDGRTEYIWVRPTHWSAHRVEGVILSEPENELLGGEGKGDSMAFAADDLTDWLHQRRTRRGVNQDGGFTIAALESAFGPPDDIDR